MGSPHATARRVDRFSSSMDAHKTDVLAAAVAVTGLVLIGRGIKTTG